MSYLDDAMKEVWPDGPPPIEMLCGEPMTEMHKIPLGRCRIRFVTSKGGEYWDGCGETIKSNMYILFVDNKAHPFAKVIRFPVLSYSSLVTDLFLEVEFYCVKGVTYDFSDNPVVQES